MEKRDFFISYTQTDKDWAVWIAETLKSNGYSVYIQALDIHPGDNFIEKMNDFLEKSGNFIAVWSKAYSESRFCMTEFQAAFNQWTQERMDCFLPVRIEEYPMGPLFSALVHADLFGKNKIAAEKELIDAVRYATSHSENKPNDVTNAESRKWTPRRPFPVRLVMKYALVLACITTLLLISNAFRPQFQEWLESNRLYQAGENYYYGRNSVEQDYAKARDFYEQSAAKGNAAALYSLGTLYYYGYGVEQDYAKARDFYEQSAMKGDVDASYSLGVLYEKGQGVGVDYAKARKYYEKAATKGNADALNNLGVFYEYGCDVAQDYAKARKYYEKAAAKGNADALNNLGWLYRHGYGVKVDYLKAREYYEQAAAKGNVLALNNLGVLYDNGYGVVQDYAKAMEYYEQAGEKGNSQALINLGWLYEYGQGIEQDYAKALEYYQRAVDFGDEDAPTHVDRVQKKLNG